MTTLQSRRALIPHSEREHELRVEGVYFTGPMAESANDYSSLKVLLRRIADYLDEHPEIEDPEIHDLTFRTVFDENDNWYVAASLYVTADKGGGRNPEAESYAERPVVHISEPEQIECPRCPSYHSPELPCPAHATQI